MRAAVSFKAHSHRVPDERAGSNRAEPPPPLFLIKGEKFELPLEDAPEETILDISEPELSAAPGAPLAAVVKVPAVARNRKFLAAIAASGLFHASIAALFLHFRADVVQLAGAEQAGVSMTGNAAEDQLASGEMDPATNVTIIPMIQADTVEANEAEPIRPAETAPTQADEVPVAERIEAVEEEPVEQAQPVEPLPEAPAETLPEQRVEALPETPLEPAPPAPAPAAEAGPQVLATDRVESVEDDNVVPAVEEEVAESPIEEETPQSPVEEAGSPVEKDEEDKAAEEIARQLAELQAVPLPSPRPTPRQAQAKPAPASAKAPAPKKPAASRSSGSGGRNHADTRRGTSDGSDSGNTAMASRGSRQNTTAGNSAASNYPGKIVSKLRRALRYPSEAKRQKLRGEVHVAFTVSGSGTVSAVRVVRSSGTSVLDSAALETVRRAAPFPPIPAEAGRSNWPFTVPLAFTR